MFLYPLPYIHLDIMIGLMLYLIKYQPFHLFTTFHPQIKPIFILALFIS